MDRIKWILVLWGILAVSTFFQLVMVESFGRFNYHLSDYLITPLASMATGIVLFFGLVLPAFDAVRNLGTIKKILILSFSGLVYGIVFIFILHVFPLIFYPNPSPYKESVFAFFVGDYHNVLKNYLFQVSILFAFEYISKERQLLTGQKNLEIELNKTKLQLLKSQLQPHFLFNSLNSVVSEIDVNKANAQEMLINLSDILRVTLDSDFMEAVTLREELEFIKKYLSIEKIRYEDQLVYDIDVPDLAMDLKVPKLILQSLVENTIKHGFKGIQRSIQIKIEADFNQKTILVKNNGKPLSDPVHFHTGLANVSERLKIFTKNNAVFEIYQNGGWVVNKINLK